MLTKNLRISKLAANLAKVARKPAAVGIATPGQDYMPVHIEGDEGFLHIDRKGDPIANYHQNVIDIKTYDDEIMDLINEEAERQRSSIDLIASSNIPIAGVNECSTLLSNKSSPGYPSGRFFNGDQTIDKVEKL